LARTRALGLSRSDLVHRFGYRDLGNGHKALSTVLLTGVVPLHIENHLAEALQVDDALFRAVSDATMRQKRDEASERRAESERAYRASFRPHLQVQIARQVPSPNFVAALLTVARLRIVHLPDGALTTDDEARGRIIKTVIIDHWREKRGRVPAFSGITGYLLVLIAGYSGVDFGLPFSITGDRTGAMQKIERLGKATLGTKRGDTRLTGLLKNYRVIRSNGQN
jgi:hypothetical protein